MTSIIKSVVAVLFSVLFSFGPLNYGISKEAYAPKDVENCNLNFAVISDTHLTEAHYPQFVLEMGLEDMQNAAVKPDALVIAGDITNHATSAEYARLYNAFSNYTPADELIFAMGNHDTWNNEIDEDDRLPESLRLFKEYNKLICDRELDKPYYTTEVNGYTFIVMASDGDSTRADLSDEQLFWLDVELAKASLKGKPIFVVCHWVLEDSHGLPNVWVNNPLSMTPEELEEENDGSFKDNRSEIVEKILKKYENVFFITGHLYNGFAIDYNTKAHKYSSVESDGSFHSINLPTYKDFTTRGAIANGTGYSIEVYDDEVVLRARCFTAGLWFTAFDVTIPLV